MPERSYQIKGRLQWNRTRALREFRKQNVTPKDLESRLWAAGLRVKLAHWFNPDRQINPSLSSFAVLVGALGLEGEPFDKLIDRFYDWADKGE